MCSQAIVNSIFLLENTQWSSEILGLKKQKNLGGGWGGVKRGRGRGERAGKGQDGEEADKAYVML